jgi:hypothetical protein
MMSELGVMRVMANRGKVYLPNYTGNGKSFDDEVRTWDVENGVDMGVVVPTMNGNVVLLVDAKGQALYPKDDDLQRTGKRIQADFISEYVTPSAQKKLPVSLQRFINEQDPWLVHRAKVIIPTNAEKLMTMKDAYSEWQGDKQAALAHFAEVSQDVEDRILRSVSGLTVDFPFAA